VGWIPRRRHKDWRPGERTAATGPSCGPGSADDDGDGNGLHAVAANTGAAGGIANTGVRIDLPVGQEAFRRPAPWPHLVGNPPGRALGFQERAESSRLRMVLEAEGTAVAGQVLSGLGGVGKTQLAADYARTAFASGRLDVLVWVTAASRQAIIDGYTRAAVELLGAEPDEHSAQRFLAWLQPSPARAACRWLVVLDDLADPADLTALWPPECASGRTVVTTRRRDAALTGPGRRRVDVGVFTSAEAAAALHQVLAERGHPAQPPGQLEALAAELGFLPLALSQAAAYITDAGLDCAAYRARLADRTRSLAGLLPRPAQWPEAGDTLPHEQAATVAATWSLSIDRADGLHPRGLARPMLQLTAVLDPNGIPQAVLTGTVARRYLSSHCTPGVGTAGPMPDEQDAEAALRVLHRLSLIDHSPAQLATAVRVHHLVQRTTLEKLVAADRDQLARTAADALLEAWPAIERDTDLAQVLRANATALHDSAGAALWHQDDGAHRVLFRAATSLGATGQVTAARTAYTDLAATAHDLLGPDHPSTLAARGNLAGWRGVAGDAAGAAAAAEELLADCLRVLGPDHPDTLTIRGGLARWRVEAGSSAGEAAACEELLADCLRVLGPDHPDTLTARSNLAGWRGVAGDAAGAAAAYEELLVDLLRVLGPDHPETLAARAILAGLRGEAGDAAGAAAAAEELLADCLRVLGPDHPDTLTARSNLAVWREQSGLE
jgi:hypothetical protein